MISKAAFYRIALYAVGGFVAFCLVLAYFGRENLFRFFLDPRVPYQTYEAPAAPDYTDTASWVLAPGNPEEAPAANIFVVTPSIYWGGKDWNTDLENEQAMDQLIRVAVPNWAGPFYRVGKVSIPKYRAASLYSFLTVRHDARNARAFAYRDVLAAFDRFYEQIDPNGPIIIMGAEQGGLHVLGLLQDRFSNKWYRERLAAAYVIDFAVPLDLFEDELKGLSPCQDASSTRCVVAYSAFTSNERKEIQRFRERSMVWDSRGRLQKTQGRALTCVNPVLGSASLDYAPPRLHKGGVAASGIEWGMEPAPIPGQTSTQCEEGILLIERPRSASLRKKISHGARFKPKRYNLFYGDLAEDAKSRVAALNIRFAQEGRLAPPFGEAIILKESPIHKTPGTK